jgi:IS30 family transposase
MLKDHKNKMENAENEATKASEPKRVGSKSAKAKKLEESQRVKRKRVVLNFFQRQEVIEMLREGMSHEKIAEQFNIGLSTLSEIKKKADDNISRYRAENSLTTEKKVFKNSSFPNVDLALKIWYYQERAKNKNITHLILQNKVK